MSPQTRSGDPFKHFLRVFMRDDSFINDVVQEEGITSYGDFVSVITDMNIINALKTKEGTHDEETISMVVANRLRLAMSYVNHLQMCHGPIGEGIVDITKFDGDDFDGYILSSAGIGSDIIPYNEDTAQERKFNAELRAKQLASISSLVSPGGTQVINPTQTSNQHVLSSPTDSARQLTLFKKALKLDPDMFPQLLQDSGWKIYQEQTESRCRTYNIKVLDPTYSPSDADEKALFDSQQNYMITILDLKVKTTSGVSIVRKYLGSSDAQQAWKDLCAYYQGAGSVQATRRRDELFDKINTPLKKDANVRLLPHFLQWDEDFAEYQELTGSQYSASDKLRQVKRHFKNIPELQSLSNVQGITAVMMNAVTVSGNPNDPDVILQVFKYQCEMIDNRRKDAVLGERSRIVNELNAVAYSRSRGGYAVNLSQQLFDRSMDDDSWYEVYNASVGHRRAPESCLPRKIWQYLTVDEKKLWDRFSDKTRQVIINCRATPWVQGRDPNLSANQDNTIDAEETSPKVDDTEDSSGNANADDSREVHLTMLVNMIESDSEEDWDDVED